MSDSQVTRTFSDFDNVGNVSVVFGNTATDINTTFQGAASLLYTLWHATTDSANTPPLYTAAAVTQPNAQLILNAAATLRSLVINGTMVHLDGNPTSALALAHVSYEQAQQADLILQSLRAAGFDLSVTIAGPNEVDCMSRWQSITSVKDILGIHASGDLLTMLNTDYIDNANTILFNKLDQLQQALTITNASLGVLTDIQALHNAVVAPEPGANITAPIKDANNLYVNNVDVVNNGLTSIFKPIVPTVKGGTDTALVTDGSFLPIPVLGIPTGTPYHLVLATTDQANQLIDTLLPAVQTQITALAGQRGSTAIQPNSLEDILTKVATDISTLSSKFPFTQPPSQPGYYQITFTMDGPLTLTPPLTVVNNVPQTQTLLFTPAQYKRLLATYWIVDNMDKSSGASASSFESIQRNITAGATAATNLNDQQQSQIKQTLFTYQQFYQSAAAILQQLNEVLTKMANNIA